MITANKIRAMMKEAEEKKIAEEKATALDIVEKLIIPSIIEAAKNGEHSTRGEVEEKYFSYVRKELEERGFTTQCVAYEKLRILW